MRLTLCITLLAAAAATTACTPAVAIHPLYAKADLDTSLPLEGAWSTSEGEVCQIRKSEDAYDVAQWSPGDSQKTQYTVHILRLRGQYFADIASKADAQIAVAGHLFARIRLEGDNLYAALIDEAWLKHAVQTGQAPAFTMGEAQQIVLIAPTPELQQFVSVHAADPDTWEKDSDALHRLH